MPDQRVKKPVDEWFGEKILPGESRNIDLPVSESYSSMTVRIPIHVKRAKEPGPVVFVTAALHGDEINGTGAVRQLIQDEAFQLTRGSVIMIPVLNILAFDRHSRYLPDRRDLNRSFPGSEGGSLAGRMAHLIFDEIVARSDYGIDIHTASIRRTNYPNVRGDLSRQQVRQLAEAFGAEIIINGKGPEKALRREACRAGCPTIIMEGGEVWKVEPGIVESATRGIRNVLRHLEMLDGEIQKPIYQVIIEKSKWIRAEKGGFLQFHVQPGELIEKDQPLATNTTLLGDKRNTLHAPFDAVVIGMTSLPAVSPGEPICNLGMVPEGTRLKDLQQLRSGSTGLGHRVSNQLASNVLVVDHPDSE
ncbi:succinylglutamate desuccinylase/aspartoacylase family protein [Puniceicoccales bacterium CK1056]|uniref:Succinylglutamate desuccinylase/aspartoacylase family protein n=1 Tax=Oceanipulchritudo coccoides TaxID=2706888 RepID=A0A6B2LZG6_9BACT|nr:succinylglutamate desuccinylase/aspartoacylase family protein [Oceanipulchritudo coccoides]NDV61439.1 succinylglutamate desuccinylase/aspartoacylase family protein [Oceanipulchritudo coccoides]